MLRTASLVLSGQSCAGSAADRRYRSEVGEGEFAPSVKTGHQPLLRSTPHENRSFWCRLRNGDLEAWEAVYGGRVPGRGISPSIYHSADHLAHNMAEVPVIIMVCMEGGRPGPGPLTRGASIYPAVQNLLLAARALGLGTALTTLHRRHEEEIKALLGIPENVETAALIPLGFPAQGEHFGGSRRRPASEVTFQEKWGRREIT